MASSPSLMCRCLCHCCNGIVALIALAPLPTLHKCCCSCCAGFAVLVVLTYLPSCHIGVVTVIAPALLPSSSWRVCAIALVLFPLSRWCCCHWCAGINALGAQESLSFLCLRHAVHSQASLLSLSWRVLSHGQSGGPSQRQQQHQINKGNNAITTRAAMLAQWGQWCQHKVGNNASTINDASMTRLNASMTRATTRTS
jgi:hypothetical protein